jgi:RNase P protein component
VVGRDGRAPGPAWHGGSRHLAAQARITPMDSIASLPVDPVAVATAARVRFGVTVGKRNARRAVERALVKRVLREAARHAAPALETAAGAHCVDVVLRLKQPCPAKAALARPLFKRQLRAEADALLAQLGAALGRRPAGTSA